MTSRTSTSTSVLPSAARPRRDAWTGGRAQEPNRRLPIVQPHKRLAFVAAAILATVMFAGCGDTQFRPGLPERYDRIDHLTNCGDLQYERDRANHDALALLHAGRNADVDLSYLRAAEARMKTVGC